MNKKQLMTMWVGILLAFLGWFNWDYDEPMMSTSIPIITVITGGLIISFSDRNYKLLRDVVSKLFKRTKKKDG